jgi:hypothetical protein
MVYFTALSVAWVIQQKMVVVVVVFNHPEMGDFKSRSKGLTATFYLTVSIVGLKNM